MRKYELLYILDPQEEKTQKTIEEIKEQYNKIGVRIFDENEMGKRKLAYEINKKADGYYYSTKVEVDDLAKLQEFETDLKRDPDVIRYLKFRL